MKIVLFGATGQAGSRILQELLSRGHTVVGVARDTSKIPVSSGVTAKPDDLSDIAKIAAIIEGADAVVSAYAPPPDDTDQLINVTHRMIAAVKAAGNPRLLVVGGAGGLEVASGISLLNSGHTPDAWRAIATSHVKAYEILKDSDINWTYFAPAAFFQPGTRTGKFRLGKDELIASATGESRISMEDYAIALVDELDAPAHRRQRFSIGY